MASVWKKRLFEQITDAVDDPTAKRRRHEQHGAPFVCPKCSAHPLEPCQRGGVCCSECQLTIQLDCNDLSMDAIERMLQLARKDHSLCKGPGQIGTMTTPDDVVFLTWTCSDCRSLEILL